MEAIFVLKRNKMLINCIWLALVDNRIKSSNLDCIYGFGACNAHNKALVQLPLPFLLFFVVCSQCVVSFFHFCYVKLSDAPSAFERLLQEPGGCWYTYLSATRGARLKASLASSRRAGSGFHTSYLTRTCPFHFLDGLGIQIVHFSFWRSYAIRLGNVYVVAMFIA